MLTVNAIPAFQDNYIWMLSIADNNKVFVIDPGDATPVLEKLKENDLKLEGILITHHHADHTGGVDTLRKFSDIPVYGPSESPYAGITHPLKDGDSCKVLGHSLSVKAVPGHTLDHICYYYDGTQAEQAVPQAHKPQLFCGDTLFLAGCGRLFEGSAKQMMAAMRFFKQLPDNTEVYCTHEYSMANLAFAKAVEPQNEAVQATINRCKSLREQRIPTIPTNIQQEKLINPFLRTASESVQLAANHHAGRTLNNEQEVFAVIRQWKDEFRG
ncbi:hydroxyacylglutathione hydrolase [Motiliproteus sp. MSK22-1]|uniref:hydroxyacylglutathione hydrolase n=1 Tax=Motiliproteus sp. MSK22-1 TaxID=1897630 RepID=UPI000978C8D8|nr:hydroxyacylglutathione hydrolase [Motiliproteus sp. MSK22-1]OMH29499.1 hydroxyacylglutathione hydrolase [Motiliproteus sp. MSK22-1]